jgi:hypothetical protein
MSVAAGGPATMSFAAFMEWYIVYRKTPGSGNDYDWLAKMPRINFGDYTEFLNGAAMMRGLLTHDSYHEYDCAMHNAIKHAQRELQKAIVAEDWDAARAWLRPGIALEPTTYDACERDNPEQLGATARQGRADDLRQALQRAIIRSVISELRSPTLSRSAQEGLVNSAFARLQNIDRNFRLNHVDLSDNHFGEGTVLDLWMREIHPYLTHRDPIFMEYETALRAKTPLSFNAQLALAQGLHARLGAASLVGRLTPELAQMIGQMSTVAVPRKRTFHNF